MLKDCESGLRIQELRDQRRRRAKIQDIVVRQLFSVQLPEGIEEISV